MQDKILLTILYLINIAPAQKIELPINDINKLLTDIQSKKLSQQQSCMQLKTLCSENTTKENLSLLKCIEKFNSSETNNIPIDWLILILQEARFILFNENDVHLTKEICHDYIPEFSKCVPAQEINLYLACLINKLQEPIETDQCTLLTERLKKLLAINKRYKEELNTDCRDDIQKFGCDSDKGIKGKSLDENIVYCLQKNIGNLNPKCIKQVLNISIQQTVSFKVDIKFANACENDAKKYCASDLNNFAYVYKCLIQIKNGNENKLSPKCQTEIIRRDRILAIDYRMSRGLVTSCREDIKKYHCRVGVSEDKNIRLSQILLCLEASEKDGAQLNFDCRNEIYDHRRMLMTDYNLSPEIVTNCANDIQNYCSHLDNSKGFNGYIIHCLMEHIHSRDRAIKLISSSCERAVEHLLKTADVGEDWRIDPFLRNSCINVVDNACRGIHGGNAQVMNCLMNQIGKPTMNENCESALMLIQYFIARDFKLDPQLYQACHSDAAKYCHSNNHWDNMNNEINVELGPIVLSCLHRIAYNDDKNIVLTNVCFKEVKRVMKQRALSVELIPEIEIKCIQDLANYCHNKTGYGAEMLCLQDNLEKLQNDCKTAIVTYTEEEAANVELNAIIMFECREVIQKYCSNIQKNRKEQDGIMNCLITHKNYAEMFQEQKCRAAIEHFQIISLKNYHFTPSFKSKCKLYIEEFCPAGTTESIVICLSEIITNYTLREQPQAISNECIDQVKLQIYQQQESIELLPKIKNACDKEIRQACSNVQPGGGRVIECLQEYNKLSEKCRRALFVLKKIELIDSSTDYNLQRKCKDMIYKYCPYAKSNILDCLKKYKDDVFFDKNCRRVVINRLIEQNKDFRFNIDLQQACKRNMMQYCSNIPVKPNEELNGKMVDCLKAKFRERKLEHECRKKIIEIIKYQALNYKLNPLLQTLCKNEINVLCKPANDVEEYGEVEECLKNALLNGRLLNNECKNEVATLIQESKADIHVDPLLQRACTTDLLKYCSDIKNGNGQQLKCLRTLLENNPETMEDDCKNKLKKRIEMFRNADTIIALPPKNIDELITQVVTSPSKYYFLIIMLSFVGVIFMFGIFCGHISKKAKVLKNK